MKSQKLGFATRNEDNDGVNNINICSDDDVGLMEMVDQLRRDFHKFLDLNYPMPKSTRFKFDVPYESLLEWQQISDKEIKTKKGCFREMEMMEEEKKPNLDLDLRLSPPGMHNGSSTCKALNLDLNESPNINMVENEIPSLILMGCTNCLMYVMVSEVEPKCPKCKTLVLIDISSYQNPAKRLRKC